MPSKNLPTFASETKKSRIMNHYNAKELIAFFLSVVAAALGTVALILPPQGVIDNSVLILIGQILLFIATLLGVDGALDRFARRHGT